MCWLFLLICFYTARKDLKLFNINGSYMVILLKSLFEYKNLNALQGGFKVTPTSRFEFIFSVLFWKVISVIKNLKKVIFFITQPFNLKLHVWFEKILEWHFLQYCNVFVMKISPKRLLIFLSLSSYSAEILKIITNIFNLEWSREPSNFSFTCNLCSKLKYS